MPYDNTVGAYLLGVIVSSTLFGVTTLQTFYYLQNYADRTALRATVAIIWLLECIHSGLSAHATYHSLVMQFGIPPPEAPPTWTGHVSIGLTGLVTFIVHIFFARRVWILSRKNIALVAFIAILATSHLVLNWAIVGASLKTMWFATVTSGPIQRWAHAFASLTLAADMSITVSLCYYLHKGRTGFNSTDTLINKLILYSINNGVLTSTVDIITLVFDVLQPDNMIYISVYLVVGKLYANSMLATLNFRRPTSKRQRYYDEDFTVNLSNPHALSRPGGGTLKFATVSINHTHSSTNTLTKEAVFRETGNEHEVIDITEKRRSSDGTVPTPVES